MGAPKRESGGCLVVAATPQEYGPGRGCAKGAPTSRGRGSGGAPQNMRAGGWDKGLTRTRRYGTPYGTSHGEEGWAMTRKLVLESTAPFQGLPELDASGNAVAIHTIRLKHEGWEREYELAE